MKTNKKSMIATAILSVSILSTSIYAVAAESRGESAEPATKKEISVESLYNYIKVEGVVKEIRDQEGTKSLVVAQKNSNLETILTLNKDAVILDQGTAEFINKPQWVEGMTIEAFYKDNLPLLAIYPAIIPPDLILVKNDSTNSSALVSRFDKELISADKSLKLNISEDTQIIDQFGNKVEQKKVSEHPVVVFYTIATKSLPAQTTPEKIIVLVSEEEKAVAVEEGVEVDTDVEVDTEVKQPNDHVIMDVSKLEYIVNNEKIVAPAAYINEQNVVMVPLRPITEALGLRVTWDGKQGSVMIGKGTASLQIGKDNYTYMKTAPIQLGTAPTIKEGTTYVPLPFFREVLKMNNAYVFEGQIVVDNEEKMQ